MNEPNRTLAVTENDGWRCWLSDSTTFQEITRALRTFEVELAVCPDTVQVYLIQREGSLLDAPSVEQLVDVMYGPAEPADDVPALLRNQAE